jgi:hypothetical protein
MDYSSMTSFPRRLATLAKISAVISASTTMVTAAIVVGAQVFSYVETGEWESFPISKWLELAGMRPATYVTADSSSHDGPSLIGQLLDLPASVCLLLIAAILLAFSLWCASVEKQFTANHE